jgi:hypothetical protein
MKLTIDLNEILSGEYGSHENFSGINSQTSCRKLKMRFQKELNLKLMLKYLLQLKLY